MIELHEDNKNKFFINFDITLKCNNRCPYCYNLDILDDKKAYNHNVFEKAIEQVNRFVEEHPDYEVQVNLLGGDPMMVKPKVLEFINRISTVVDIFTNLNYDFSLVEDLSDIDRVHLTCSWHLSSDIEKVKNNLIRYQGDKEIAFFVTDENKEIIYEHVEWAINNNIQYRLESIRDENEEDLFTGDERFQELMLIGKDIKRKQGYKKPRETHIDKTLGEEKDISRQYMLTCRINQFAIRYDGTIVACCGYPYRSHIDKGFESKDVFCNGHICFCDTSSYKRLVRER